MINGVRDVFSFGGELLEVSVEGRRIVAALSPNTVELDRRRKHGLGPVLDRDLLRVLTLLPHGHPVRWDDIDPMDAAILDVAPVGVVEVTKDTVTRRFEPGVELRGVYVSDRSWRRGLERVSLFAADAPRGLALHSQPQTIDDVVFEARRVGIGVALPDGRAISVCSRRYVRSSARRWRFLEILLGKWLANPAVSAAEDS